MATIPLDVHRYKVHNWRHELRDTMTDPKAPWREYATEAEHRRHAEIMSAIADLTAEAKRIMRRCIQRMRRNKEPKQ